MSNSDDSGFTGRLASEPTVHFHDGSAYRDTECPCQRSHPKYEETPDGYAQSLRNLGWTDENVDLALQELADEVEERVEDYRSFLSILASLE
jgi:hypothetical protein